MVSNICYKIVVSRKILFRTEIEPGMIPRMQVFVKEGRTEKFMRWVGFIQGVLWILGVYTLEDLMGHNSADVAGEKLKESA